MREFFQEMWKEVYDLGNQADNPDELRARADWLANEGHDKVAEDLAILAYVLERVKEAKAGRRNMAAH